MAEKIYFDQTKLLQHIDWYMLMKEKNYGNSTITFDEVIMLITEVPTADVVEVRHGIWLDEPFDGKPVPFDEHYNEGCVPQYSCYCSVCGEWLTASDEYAVIGRYCPNCGAKMDGKDGAD